MGIGFTAMEKMIRLDPLDVSRLAWGPAGQVSVLAMWSWHHAASLCTAVQEAGNGGDVSGLTCHECSGSLEVGVGGLASFRVYIS